MARFESARALAQRLLLRNGVSATLRRYSETVADASKPWRSGTTTATDYTAPMVFVPAGEDDSYVEGQLTHMAGIKILIAGDDLTVTPNLKDEVINGSDTWRIVNVKTVEPNNEQVVHVLLGVK